MSLAPSPISTEDTILVCPVLTARVQLQSPNQAFKTVPFKHGHIHKREQVSTV